MEAHLYFNLIQNPFISKYKDLWVHQPGVPVSVHDYVHALQRESYGCFPAAGYLREARTASAGPQSMTPSRGGQAALCGSGFLGLNAPIRAGRSNLA